MNNAEWTTIAPNRPRRERLPAPREEPIRKAYNEKTSDEIYDYLQEVRRENVKRLNPIFVPFSPSYDPNNNFTHYKYLRPTRFNTTQSNHGLQPNPNDLYLENLDLMTEKEKDKKKVLTQSSGQKKRR